MGLNSIEVQELSAAELLLLCEGVDIDPDVLAVLVDQADMFRFFIGADNVIVLDREDGVFSNIFEYRYSRGIGLHREGQFDEVLRARFGNDG